VLWRSRRRVFRSLRWLVSSSGHCPSVCHDVSAHPNPTGAAHTVAGVSGLCRSCIPSERHAEMALRRGLACSRSHVPTPSAMHGPLADFAPALPRHLTVRM